VLRILHESGTPLSVQLQVCRSTRDELLLHGGVKAAPPPHPHPHEAQPETDGGGLPGTATALLRTVVSSDAHSIQLGVAWLRWLEARQLQAADAGCATGERDRQRQFAAVRLLVTGHGLDAAAAQALLFGRPLLAVTTLDIRCPCALTPPNLRQLACWSRLRSLSLRVSNMHVDALELGCLAGLPSLGSLAIIDPARGPLTRVSDLPTRLTELRVLHHSGLRQLDVLGLGGLLDLSCSGNALTSLDLTGCSRLTRLDCSGNALTTLISLASCHALVSLRCSYNCLQGLDLSNARQLSELLADCQRNATLGLTGLRFMPGAVLERLSMSIVPAAAAMLPPAVTSLAGLRSLVLSCDDIEASLSLGSALSHLGVTSLSICNGVLPDAWRVPGALELPDLAKLEVINCQGVAALDCTGASNLTRLVLTDMEDLVEVSGDAPRLRSLVVAGMGQLERVELRGEGCDGAEMEIIDCPSLQSVDVPG
jgi:hypothetical protein